MDAPAQGTPVTFKDGSAASSAQGRGWLLFGVGLALLSCLPFLVVNQPQLTDYASHLARYHVMLDQGRSPFLAQYYGFDWRLTGNLGADLLIWPLARVFGLETAGWLLGFLLPPLTGLGLVAVEWTLRRRIGVGSLLAMALIWSPAMGLGFYNFCLSLALALFAFALWVRLEAWRWRWLVFLPIGMAVWISHVSGWGVLGVLVFGYEWHRRKGLQAFLAPWPLTLPVLPQVLFAGGAKGALSYGPAVFTYKSAIWMQALRDQSWLIDYASLILLVLILAVATIARKIDGRLGWAALIFAVLTIAVPRHLGGGDYADYRLIAVALMIGCLAIDWRGAPRLLLLAAPLLFLGRLGVTTAAWERNGRELDLALKALDHMPQGARVAGAVAVNARGWSLNPFEHAPSFATVRRDALVNSHFAIPGVHMLSVKEGGPGFADTSQRITYWRGQPIDLASFGPLMQTDYLWYFGDRPPATMPAGAKVLYRTRGSFLARLAKPGHAR